MSGVNIYRAPEVLRPVPDPVKSSILDHATVEDNPNQFGLRNDEGLWPSYNCLDTAIPTAMCPDPLGAGKQFGFADWTPGFIFAIQAGAQCKMVGLDADDQKAEVTRVFELNEGKAIEAALLLNRFVAAEPDAPVQWNAPIDLTPVGGPSSGLLSLTVALALLEGFAAANYAGLPTIHMPRAAASMLAAQGLISWTNGIAYTKAGSKIACGGGYDISEVDGTWDLYATGEVYVEKGGIIVNQQPVIPGAGPIGSAGEGFGGLGFGIDGFGSDDYPITDNSMLALVERFYRVGVDCFVAKCTATVW